MLDGVLSSAVTKLKDSVTDQIAATRKCAKDSCT